MAGVIAQLPGGTSHFVPVEPSHLGKVSVEGAIRPVYFSSSRVFMNKRQEVTAWWRSSDVMLR